jgi:hypothetical protein
MMGCLLFFIYRNVFGGVLHFTDYQRLSFLITTNKGY